jgi:hypothetical protein
MLERGDREPSRPHATATSSDPRRVSFEERDDVLYGRVVRIADFGCDVQPRREAGTAQVSGRDEVTERVEEAHGLGRDHREVVSGDNARDAASVQKAGKLRRFDPPSVGSALADQMLRRSSD